MKKVILLGVVLSLCVHSPAFGERVRITIESYANPSLGVKNTTIPFAGTYDPNNTDHQLEMSYQAMLLALSPEGWNLSSLGFNTPTETCCGGWIGEFWNTCVYGSSYLPNKAFYETLLGYGVKPEDMGVITPTSCAMYLVFHTDLWCERLSHDICESVDNYGVISGTTAGTYRRCPDDVYPVVANWGEFKVEPVPPSPELVGYWKFDENSGGMAYDSSGYGNDGQISGATWVEGKCGSGLSFDGAVDGYLDYVVISDQGPMSIDTSTFTISFWMKLFDLNRHYSLLDKRHGYHLHNYWFAFYDSSTPPGGDTGDYLIAGINDGTIDTSIFDEGPFARVDDPPLMQPNVFYFVTATYDSISGDFILYLDGNVVGTNNVMPPNPIIGDGDLYIGAHPRHGSTYATHGIIDEVRIYNHVLTQEEIRADMEACVPPPDLSGCIKLNGEPLANKEVTLKQQRGPNLTVMTGSDGCYEFGDASVGKKIKIEVEGP